MERRNRKKTSMQTDKKLERQLAVNIRRAMKPDNPDKNRPNVLLKQKKNRKTPSGM